MSRVDSVYSMASGMGRCRFATVYFCFWTDCEGLFSFATASRLREKGKTFGRVKVNYSLDEKKYFLLGEESQTQPTPRLFIGELDALSGACSIRWRWEQS